MYWRKLVEVLAQLDTVLELTEALGYTNLAASEAKLDRLTVMVGNGSGYAFKIVHCWIKSEITLQFLPRTTKARVLDTLGDLMKLAMTHQQHV